MNRDISGLILALLLCVFFLPGCHAATEKSSPSPENAFEELRLAVRDRDLEHISTQTDLNQFLERTYDTSASEMSKVIDTLNQRYPEDPFFWHDTAFMERYTREHRSISLNFMKEILSCYFSGQEPAATYEENPVSWLSGELARLHEASTAELKDIRRKDDNHVTAVLLLKGDGSPYGNLTDGIRLELTMERQTDGHWKFTGIENIPELILPVTDKAEMFWTLQGWQ